MNPQKILNNPYGYKVCYREKHGKEFVRKFITKTYRQAVEIKKIYQLETMTIVKQFNHPTWNIFPITKKEVKAGIWKEDPF